MSEFLQLIIQQLSTLPTLSDGAIYWGALELRWAWILLLLPLPYLLRFVLPAKNASVTIAPKLPFAAALDELPESSVSTTRGMGWLYLVLWAFLLLAAARPHWLGEPQPLPQAGRDLLLAVDLSGSMQTADMGSSQQPRRRVDAVLELGGDFIGRRIGDRVGLILFGTQAYLQSPLTFDRNTVRGLLSEAELGLAGDQTAIGDAIGLAVKRLQDLDENRRVVILLTDGENTAGALEPAKAAELAAVAGLKIYTIGIGADRMVQQSIFGNQVINPSRGLDEATLKEIAAATGGRYFRAKSERELSQIYAVLDELEPVEADAETIRPRRSLLHWPLLVALLATALLLIRSRRDW